MEKKIVIVAALIFCLVLPARVFAEELKVGVMNFRKAFLQYQKTKDFQKQLEAKDKDAKDEFDKKAQEIRKLRDEIELLSEKAKAKKREELLKKTNELSAFRRSKGEELMQWRDTKIREINEDIVNTTATFAKKNGYDIIFDQMSSVYSAEKFDITDKIIKEMQDHKGNE